MTKKTKCEFCKKQIAKENAYEIITSTDFQTKYICDECNKKFEEYFEEPREGGGRMDKKLNSVMLDSKKVTEQEVRVPVQPKEIKIYMCKNCGRENNIENANYCTYCGKKL
ncbi:zinc-ribbon domain-containing protein (plasmid) [Crassaminicella thermophila]|uniref:Zinc-ribbon domain-containing protein n=1 Tax=Crassaminicella thermophila TaxID=2599308 RepID=A0A5C0SHF3_CRATE|nr:zinc-ribbon domain-containing protein [Crassaminicella thermophila]QEK13751.1 zinc-ribbon domain-containing protein [Crassaminicella thermophila]